MNLTLVRIKNFLSISDAEIRPGKITQICGANRQGKTSVIKALQFAIKGSGAGSLVKKGEDEAEVILEFDDQTSIRRKINSDGKQSPVKVRKGDFAADKPQGLLDGLFGDGAFNLLSLLEPKKRTEVLLSVIPLQVTEGQLKEAMGDCPIGVPPVDYTQHGLKVAQQANRYLYQRRKEANDEAKKAEERYRVKKAELPELPPRKSDERAEVTIRSLIEQSKSEIAVEQSKAEAAAAQAERTRAEENLLRANGKRITETHAEIILLTEKLANAQKRLEQLEADKIVIQERWENMKREAAAAGPNQERIDALNRKIQSCMDEQNEQANRRTLEERYKSVEILGAEAEKLRDFASKLTAAVDGTGQIFMEKLISTAKLPIEGLTFEGDEFKLNGNAIENLSGAEALTLALAVARAVAGPAKLICMDGAEALDEKSFQQLHEMTKDDGFQYFLSKVGPNFEKRGTGDVVVQMSGGEAAVI